MECGLRLRAAQANVQLVPISSGSSFRKIFFSLSPEMRARPGLARPSIVPSKGLTSPLTLVDRRPGILATMEADHDIGSMLLDSYVDLAGLRIARALQCRRRTLRRGRE